MSIFEFDQEANDRELYNYALEKGIEQGAEREREDMILSFARQNVPIETIAVAAKMTVPQVEAILEKVTVMA